VCVCGWGGVHILAYFGSLHRYDRAIPNSTTHFELERLINFVPLCRCKETRGRRARHSKTSRYRHHHSCARSGNKLFHRRYPADRGARTRNQHWRCHLSRRRVQWTQLWAGGNRSKLRRIGARPESLYHQQHYERDHRRRSSPVQSGWILDQLVH